MRLPECIRCPKCLEGLQGQDGQGEAGEPTRYICQGCGLAYPVTDHVVDFLPGDLAVRKRGQKLMESPRMVKIYEGRWWRGSKLFARFMGLTLAEEIALVKRITRPGDDDTILDLACGTGIYARAFAVDGPRRKVFGLDLSWPMLRYATDQASRIGLHNVHFLHGDAHHLPFGDESLDVANCCGALHLFSDVRQVLDELRRTIRPGGRLSVAAAWRSEQLWNRIHAYADEKFWDIHFFRGEELVDLLDRAGFDPVVYHSKGLWIIAGGCRLA